MALAGLKKQINKANQLVSDKVGAVEGTKFTGESHEMEKKTDATVELIDEMISKTKEYLQPNPATRAKLTVTSKAQAAKGHAYNQPEGTFGEAMIKYGRKLGEDSNFETIIPASRRANLIRALQLESRHLRYLRSENADLRDALEEHQITLQFVMQKFRALKAKFSESKKQRPLPDNLILDDQSTIASRQAEKINEMAAVMAKALALDANIGVEDQKLIDKLRKENDLMRNLLDKVNVESENESESELTVLQSEKC